MVEVMYECTYKIFIKINISKNFIEPLNSITSSMFVFWLLFNMLQKILQYSKKESNGEIIFVILLSSELVHLDLLLLPSQ